MKAWKQGAFAGVVAGIAAGGITGAAASSGLDAGNLAEWFGAVGTVGALAVTYRLLRHELDIRRAEEIERAWSQARLVTVESEAFMLVPQEGEEPPPHVRALTTVRNHSMEPVSDVEVQVRVGEHFVSQSTLGVLAPGQNINIPNEWLLGGFPRDRSVPAEATVKFVDSRGRRWQRVSNGALFDDGPSALRNPLAEP